MFSIAVAPGGRRHTLRGSFPRCPMLIRSDLERCRPCGNVAWRGRADARDWWCRVVGVMV
eukprot:8656057-Lingulodinium_polyedra.AAC.1